MKMKIRITEIEASAEELRQSNSLADGLTRMMRNAFNPYYSSYVESEEDGEEEDEKNE